MNRFRTRRKAKAADQEQTQNGFNAKLIKRGKPAASPPKTAAALDLSAALPPSDDFRTSLLMTSMSARFSMLREQDDPYSKIGKASDDSVLAPKRVSRLGDFGFTPSSKLSDIDETSSIKDTAFRPPFATSRSQSYNSDTGYGTDEDTQNGSMMGRSRPGEGNNLFGGRQKIYKIPVSSQAASATPDSGSPKAQKMGGRVVYENDVSLSAFQKLREKERMREREHGRAGLETDLTSTADWFGREAAPSPTYSGYNANRETASSTISGQSGRTSTAATSIASQGASSIRGGIGRSRDDQAPLLPALERTRSRRLYEQGLDRQLHDQQSSAMTRLEQISRQRALGGTPPPGFNSSLSHAGSATNLHDRFDRAGQSAPNTRPASPPASGPQTAIGGFDFGLNGSKSSSPVVGPGPKLPLSPPMSEGDSTFPQLGHSDQQKLNLSKARPSQDYDDEEYSERQILMQQQQQQQDDSTSSPEASPQSKRDQPESRQRTRSESANRRKALQFDSYKLSDPPKRPVFLDAPNLNGLQQPFLSPASISDISSHGESETEGEKILSDFENDNSQNLTQVAAAPTPDSEERSSKQSSRPQPLVLSSREQKTTRSDSDAQEKGRKGSIATMSHYSTISSDSPTLGDGAGLSGLVRQHLRNQSGASSNYADPSSPMISRVFADDYVVGKDPSRLSTHSIFAAAGNPWGSTDEKTTLAPPDTPPIPGFMPSPLSVASSTFGRNSGRSQSRDETSKPMSPPSSANISPAIGTDSVVATKKPVTKPVSAIPKKDPVPPSYPHTPPSDDYWKKEEEKLVRSVIRDQSPKIPSPQARRQERRAQEPKLRGIGEAARKRGPTHGPAQPQERGPSSNDKVKQQPTDRNVTGYKGHQGRSESPQMRLGDSQSFAKSNPEFSQPTSRARSNSNSPSPSHLGRPLYPLNTGSSVSLASASHSTRPSPLTPFSANSTPPLDDLPPQSSSAVPSNPPNFTQSTHPASYGRTKSINKADISEPSLFHTTNPMTNAVPLPPGTSLSNGSSSNSAPPLPPVNPRRRHQAAQVVKSAFSGNGINSRRTSPPTPVGGRSASEERSAFEEDGDTNSTSFRARIRKISSDGGTLRSRAAISPPIAAPPMPRTVKTPSPPPTEVMPQRRPVQVDGGMF